MEFIDKLRSVKEKFDKINDQLADPDIANKQDRLIALSKERSELLDVVEAYEKYIAIVENIKGNEEIIASGEDKELSEMAEAELQSLKNEKLQLEEDIKLLLIPKDPNDTKNVIVEVRAGTGGDEAGLFASDLYRMYSRYAVTDSATTYLLTKALTAVVDSGTAKSVRRYYKGAAAGKTGTTQNSTDACNSGLREKNNLPVLCLPTPERKDPVRARILSSHIQT